MLFLSLFACDLDDVNLVDRAADPPTEDSVESDDTDTAADTADTDDVEDTGETDSATTETGDSDSPADTGFTLPMARAKWTILVFINGDNDLEEWALADMNEMEMVGSTDEVRVVVQMDRSTRYNDDDGNWSGARRYLATKDESRKTIGSAVLEDLGKTDSGVPETVIDFVSWGATNFPADRYALVMWDHGDNWLFAPGNQTAATKGISYDYGSGSDLSVARGDYEEAIAGAQAALGQPIDLLGSDACTMNSWEVLHTVAPYATAYVGSQDYEDVAGWPYDTVLADLTANPDMDPLTLGAIVAQRFNEIPDSTMSVVDLAQFEAFDGAVDTLADALLAHGSGADLFVAAAGGAQGFDGNSSIDHDFLDLVDRLDEGAADADFTVVLNEVRAAHDALVTANYNVGGRVGAAQGVSIYSPARASVMPLYLDGGWCSESRWCTMLETLRAP